MRTLTLTLLAVFLTASVHAAEKPSQGFLKKAIEGNYAEIEMGKLAQRSGQNENVKNFGVMLTEDHSAANQKAIAAAKSMGMTPPDGPTAKQKASYDKMSKLSGPQFDREFGAYMVVDHQKDIEDYRKGARQADAAGEYAKSQIGVLQKHLETARSLRSKTKSNR